MWSRLRNRHGAPLQAILHHCSKPKAPEHKDPCTGRPKPLMDFTCKAFIITGGCGGIGLATAHELLTEKAKCVALVGTDNCQGKACVNILNNHYGHGKAIFLNCDVQSRLQVCAMYQRALEELGGIDGVVNSAGIFNGAEYEHEIAVNLVGAINCINAAYSYMSKEAKGPGGVILNFSGLGGVQPLHAAPTYAACSHGVIGLSRSFGDERNYAKTGLRIVTLCPGFTSTKFLKDAEQRAFHPSMAQDLRGVLTTGKRQGADACAQAAIHVLKHGLTASVWIVDGSHLYSLQIPTWEKYRTLESQIV